MSDHAFTSVTLPHKLAVAYPRIPEVTQVKWTTSTEAWAMALQSWMRPLTAVAKTFREATRVILADHALTGSASNSYSGIAAAIAHTVLVMCGHAHRLTTAAGPRQAQVKFTKGLVKESSAMKRKAMLLADAEPNDQLLQERATSMAEWHQSTVKASKRARPLFVHSAFVAAVKGGPQLTQKWLSRTTSKQQPCLR